MFAQPVGIFQQHADIGNPKIKGSTNYNSGDQSYNIKGAGYNVWFGRDEFQYAYNKVKGDFILTANFKLIEKALLLIAGRLDGAGERPGRCTPYERSRTWDGMTSLQWRSLRGAHMRDPQDQIVSRKTNVEIIQLERVGKVFIMRIANPGEPLQRLAELMLQIFQRKPWRAFLFVVIMQMYWRRIGVECQDGIAGS
jgi:hypothetical protein